MSFIDDSVSCWCFDELKEQTDSCIICNKSQTIRMHEFTRKAQCPLHSQIGYLLYCKFLCLDCSSMGWKAKSAPGGFTICLPEK
jgi:hypothetical protein